MKTFDCWGKHNSLEVDSNSRGDICLIYKFSPCDAVSRLNQVTIYVDRQEMINLMAHLQEILDASEAFGKKKQSTG